MGEVFSRCTSRALWRCRSWILKATWIYIWNINKCIYIYIEMGCLHNICGFLKIYMGYVWYHPRNIQHPHFMVPNICTSATKPWFLGRVWSEGEGITGTFIQQSSFHHKLWFPYLCYATGGYKEYYQQFGYFIEYFGNFKYIKFMGYSFDISPAIWYLGVSDNWGDIHV